LALGCFSPFLASGQVDPIPRDLIQVGYNGALEGHAPLAFYTFYFHNQPNFLHTNLTLRLAIAPTYIDSELGIRQVLDPNTDLGIGFAGGGFADSYDEINNGTFLPSQSFIGHGGQTSLSLYHCFNPDDMIPLNGVLRGLVHYSTYSRDEGTANNFELPADHTTVAIRTGLRWGGKEPILFPSLAMELSIWYEGQYRTPTSRYGFNDRSVKEWPQLLWGQALLAYTFTNSGNSFYINLTAGTSQNADRLSAYRLGAMLPLVSEFPLSLPGYYYGEISARQFALLGGNCMLPLDKQHHWSANFVATAAVVDYLPGLEQPGNFHSGVGGGILYSTHSLKVMVGYAYGVEAIRSGGRGANSVGILMQLDLGRARQEFYPSDPGMWRGFQRVTGIFGH
jgi:hypothetical protein